MKSIFRGVALFSVVLAAGCGRTEDFDEVEARQGALSVTNARILGFETPVADWSVINGGSGTISSSPTHSEGSSSLAINAKNFVSIRSVAMSSLGADVMSTIHYDVMLPPQQPNPNWFGTTQLYVNIPSKGIFSVFLGQVEMTGFPLSQFKRVDYTLPANVLTALRGTYTDLQFTIVINVPSNATGIYRLDNFQVTPPAVTPTITQIGADTFTNATSQHATQVEPDSFAFGSTIVTVAQTGRFVNDGGSSDIAFATSHDNGGTWVRGNLPNLTAFSGGAFDRSSDPSVAFDAKHNVWLVSTLLFNVTSATNAVVAASRSTDGGLTWSSPVTVVAGGSALDKNWIVCDNTSTSPFFGNCYTEWDDPTIHMSTSTDGGSTWGPQKNTADSAVGVGGQPVVQANGTVIVMFSSNLEGMGAPLLAFRSTDGGVSWSATTPVATMQFHQEAGLRSEALASAEVDGAGTVYVVWPDCGFRSGCTANDLVMSTSTNGVTWSPVVRIPIDAVTSTVDHFIPGLGVDVGTSGASAHLALTYYYYPDTSCTVATCQLNVGFITSANGGSTWSASSTLAGPMSLSWLADTSLGRMVGDYVSTSFAGGTAHSFFAVASAPVGGVFNEALFTSTNPVTTTAAAAATSLAEPAPPSPMSSAAAATASSQTIR